MHAPITVGRGLWGAVADAVCLRKRRNFPNRLGLVLGPGLQARICPGFLSSRAGGVGFRDLGGGRRGGCAKSGFRRGQGWRKKVFATMTWGALSEACRVPPQETVIRGRCGDSCACRSNRSKYKIIHTIQTDTYDTYNTCNTDTYIHCLTCEN
jgi:hypothetical protein